LFATNYSRNKKIIIIPIAFVKKRLEFVGIDMGIAKFYSLKFLEFQITKNL
jgi:hypothetical protein